MRERCTLKINEIFHSFQGEGARVGKAAIFLRLAGCSLHCPYCDTKEAWNSGTEMLPTEIGRVIEKHLLSFPGAQVVFTGGEPLEQDLSVMVDLLKSRGCFLAIETHGGLFQPLPIDWWTVAPKDVTDYSIHPQLIPHINEIKLIVNKNLTLGVLAKLRQTTPAVPFFLQPDETNENRYEDTYHLFKQCQEAGLVDVRCGIQLHRIYNVK